MDVLALDYSIPVCSAPDVAHDNQLDLNGALVQICHGIDERFNTFARTNQSEENQKTGVAVATHRRP